MDPGVALPESRRKEVEAFVRLKTRPGLGDRSIRDLVVEHGSGQKALAALDQGELWDDPPGPLPDIDGWLRGGLGVLPMTAEEYPPALLELVDPPPVIFLRGRGELLFRTAVGVVGARRATEVGRRVSEELGAVLAGAGFTVVSGMARGIDSAAHWGALRTGGDTVGVLGTGPDIVYPRSNAKLFREVIERGLLASEFLPGQEAAPHHFPRRNRIIAALARAVIVVEAGARSGALITVEHALDLGRDVMAVPGSVENPRARGTNALLRDGARVLTGPEDVLEELAGIVELPDSEEGTTGRTASPGAGLSPELRTLWDALGTEPRDLDDVAREAELSADRALAGLSTLELEGWASRCPGMRYRRR